MTRTIVSILMILGLFLSGCAFDLAHVSYAKTEAVTKSGKSFKVREAIALTGMPCWKNRTIAGGTTWNLIGTIPEGEVYKSNSQTLTVECSNIHEAYLVVRDKSVVGFYLPVERGFVTLPEPVALKIE